LINDDSPPDDVWDDELASRLLGRLVLVGINHFNADGALTKQEQVFGKVEYVDSVRGFRIRLQGKRSGEDYYLPPDTRSFREAAPGEYRLRSTGEVVMDPDFTTEWIIDTQDRSH
jgi:hypothetical protein